MATLRRPSPSAVAPAATCGGQDQGDRREREHRRLRARAGRVVVLLGTAQASGQHGGPEHQQNVPDDGSDDRRLYDVVEPRAQGGERDDEFGGIAEGRVEQPADPLAHALRKLLGRAAHPRGQGQDGQSRGGEDQEMPVGREKFQADRDGDEEQEPVHQVSALFSC